MELLVGEKEKRRGNKEKNTDTEENRVGREVVERGGNERKELEIFFFFQILYSI